MGCSAPAVGRANTRVASHVDDAVTRLLTQPAYAAVGIRTIFLETSDRPGVVRAVIAFPRPEPLLADVCTMFEYFGLRVAGQQRLNHAPHADADLHLFEFVTRQAWCADGLAQVAAAVEARDAHGFAVDIYAGLILTANVTWRQVVLVRAASRFLRQAGLGMSHHYVVDMLKDNPAFVTAFADYFAARFDPDIDARDQAVAAAAAALAGPVDAATTLDEDRILRAFASFVEATLRTNWFQVGADGAPKRYASFLLNSARLSLRGPVVPYREIFVDANDVEGIHMRSGLVARGGLRLSDRPEDYRTEVLGLMKTQTVKNSPIVPVGAKGAFIRKNPDTTPEQAYSTFIAGLLDVVDNLVDGRCVTPARTVTYSGEDSYLVVAADKGTAKFSDLANAPAVERRFWLGDAFASGGSAGYDHKVMGITARGAWLSVRRHFDDLGVDVAKDPVTVAGIGDMSGDVFGNGMLLSRSIRLVAAFDHRHIFIDPDPDPAASYAERERLAALPVSSWADYSGSKLSAGGGVWPRTAKSMDIEGP